MVLLNAVLMGFSAAAAAHGLGGGGCSFLGGGCCGLDGRLLAGAGVFLCSCHDDFSPIGMTMGPAFGEDLRDFRCDNAMRDRACMLQMFAAVASMRIARVQGPVIAAGVRCDRFWWRGQGLLTLIFGVAKALAEKCQSIDPAGMVHEAA